MGLLFSRIWERMVGREERRILMVGLDAAGKVSLDTSEDEVKNDWSLWLMNIIDFLMWYDICLIVWLMYGIGYNFSTKNSLHCDWNVLYVLNSCIATLLAKTNHILNFYFFDLHGFCLCWMYNCIYAFVFS